MRLWAVGLLAAALIAPALAADDKKDEPPGRAERFQAIQKDFQAAVPKLREAIQEAKSPEERQEVMAKATKPFVDRAVKLAEEDPKDDVAFQALQFAMQFGGTDKAVDLLVAHHLGNARLGAMIAGAGRSGSPAGVKLIKAVMEKGEGDLKAQATFALGQALATQAESAADPAKAKGLSQEAEKLFERVAKEYADVKAGRGTLGQQAEDQLYVLRNLSVGRPAPEIDGEDTDGKKFKLSDYKGKVVMLDFWGHW
jgi:AhpC/TSA family